MSKVIPQRCAECGGPYDDERGCYACDPPRSTDSGPDSSTAAHEAREEAVLRVVELSRRELRSALGVPDPTWSPALDEHLEEVVRQAADDLLKQRSRRERVLRAVEQFGDVALNVTQGHGAALEHPAVWTFARLVEYVGVAIQDEPFEQIVVAVIRGGYAEMPGLGVTRRE